MLINILASVIVVGGLAFIFGFGLTYADKKLSVMKDEKTAAVEDVLPGVNCGACGYPGCSGYAEAVATGRAELDLCSPGGSAVTVAIGKIMGREVSAKTPVTARIKCGGDDNLSVQKYFYNGVADCLAASSLQNGFLVCPTGCLGLGSCVQVCKFDALSIDENGKISVDQERCTGCGACVKACPRDLIILQPVNKKVHISCSSTDKGGVCNKYCKVSCIGCMRCVKECPVDAITVTDFLAVIDPEKCINCGKCVTVCPKKCIEQQTITVQKSEADEESKAV